MIRVPAVAGKSIRNVAADKSELINEEFCEQSGPGYGPQLVALR